MNILFVHALHIIILFSFSSYINALDATAQEHANITFTLAAEENPSKDKDTAKSIEPKETLIITEDKDLSVEVEQTIAPNDEPSENQKDEHSLYSPEHNTEETIDKNISEQETESELLPEPLVEDESNQNNGSSKKRENNTESSAKKKAADESKNCKNTTRTISVTNSIDDSMLGYSHWTGTYTPKTFVVRVNGKKIGSEKRKNIEIEKNKFVVRYDYDFGYNVKKARGAVEITFKMDKNAAECDLTFSWDNPWRIIIDNAEPLSEEKCEFDA